MPEDLLAPPDEIDFSMKDTQPDRGLTSKWAGKKTRKVNIRLMFRREHVVSCYTLRIW